MKNYLLTIEYDGTYFVGWQRQCLPNANNRSVQETVEKALKKLLHQEITIHGAGRTDSGVHGLGQTASFMAETTLPAENMAYALNGLLPSDVRILGCVEVPADFHARYSAVGKNYEYYLMNKTQYSAFNRRYAYVCNYRLDFALMQEAARIFEGRHNLKSFTANGNPVASYEREIYYCHLDKITNDSQLPWQRSVDLWRLNIFGSGFLYKTVRLIMGGLIAVGRGKITTDDLRQALAEPGKIIAPPAPSHGLYMKEVFYSRELLEQRINEEKTCLKQGKSIDICRY